MAGLCGQCGLNHRRLGVRFDGRTLKRRAKSSKHLLRSFDAWAFLASFYYAHVGDFDFVEIADTDTGNVYSTSKEAFELNAFWRDLGAGNQIILPLRYWQIGGKCSGARGARLQQLPLFLGAR